jgi:hypothetical protein
MRIQLSTAPASDGTLRDMVQKLAQVQFDPEEEPIRITVRHSILKERDQDIIAPKRSLR